MTPEEHVHDAHGWINKAEDAGADHYRRRYLDLAYVHLRAAEVGWQSPAVEVVDPTTEAIVWKGSSNICPTCGASEKHSDITRTQWLAHHEEYYQRAREHGADKSTAGDWADGRTQQRFGTEPMPPDPRDSPNR